MCPPVSSLYMEDLEHQLQNSLKKVEPNQEFVDHLHSRLTNSNNMSVERRQSIGWGMFLVATSLLSGVLLIWLVRLFRPAEAH